MRLLLLPLAVGAALVLAPGAGSAKPWLHAILAPRSDEGFAVMAGKHGFADKEGLELETVDYESEVLALRALDAGEVDSYEGGAATAIVAASDHRDLKIIGCPWQGVAQTFIARASILSPQDLRGQIIGISEPASVSDLVARAYLAVNGVESLTVRFVGTGSGGERFRALESGMVAATSVSIEFLPQAEDAGLKLLARGGDLLPNFLRRCIMAADRTLNRRREDAVRFLAAEMIGLRYALRHREDELALTRAAAGLRADDPRPAALFAEAARPAGIDPSLPIPLDKLAAMEELLIKAGALTRAFDPKQMVDEEIRDIALQRIGRE